MDGWMTCGGGSSMGVWMRVSDRVSVCVHGCVLFRCILFDFVHISAHINKLWWVLHLSMCHTLQGVAIFVFHVVRHEKNWGKLKKLFTSKIGRKRQDTRTSHKSGTLSVRICIRIYL